MTEPLDPQRLTELHRRLLTGDRVVPGELAEILLHRLARELTRRFPHFDRHSIYDGVTDAILDYCSRPVSFDASRRVPLDRFLARAAWRNIANLLRGEQRRKAREEKSVENSGDDLVELRPSVGNSLQTEALLRQRMVETMRALEDPVDRKVLELRMMGERRTQKFAEVMGISDLSPVEQRQKVKRTKDRIEKLLQRKKGLRK